MCSRVVSSCKETFVEVKRVVVVFIVSVCLLFHDIILIRPFCCFLSMLGANSDAHLVMEQD